MARASAFFSVLACMLIFAGCAVNPATGKSELALVPVSTSQEIALGQKEFPRAVQEMGGEYPDPQLHAYLNEVGTRVARQSQRPALPYEFEVVNDSTPNAFALPGGFIAITRGLLVDLDNEAELAAVLGHEVGHVAARHAVAGMQRGTLLNGALSVLSAATGDTSYGSLAERAGKLTADLIDKSYSRDQERQADRLGIDYMVRAKYNPEGAVQVQELFYRKLEGGAQPQWLRGLFRTHPFSRERMEDNRSYILSHYPQDLNRPDFGFGVEAFQTATAGLRKTREGYVLYDKARGLEKKGEDAKAVAVYLQAAAAAPDEALIRAGLGTAYLKAGDLNSAHRQLTLAVHEDGNYYYSRLGLGYVYLQKGQTGRALKELEASMKLLPTLSGEYLLAEGYEKSGQRQKALTLYRTVARSDAEGTLGRAAARRVRALEGK